MATIVGRTGLAEFETWLGECNRGLQPSTIRLYLNTLKRVPLDMDPQEWLVQRITRDTPIGTTRPLKAAIGNWIRYREGRDDIELPKLPKPRKRVRYGRNALSPSDLEAFKQTLDECALPTTTRAILHLLTFTGLRISELCSVRRSGLALNRTATNQPGLTVVGKGDKERWVPLAKDGRRVVRTYLAEAALEDLDTSKWLFPAMRGSGHASPGTVRVGLRSIRDRLPVTARRMTPHVLRHTVATRLLAKGVAERTIQHILGHASITTTQIYLHPSKDMIADAFNRLYGDDT